MLMIYARVFFEKAIIYAQIYLFKTLLYPAFHPITWDAQGG